MLRKKLQRFPTWYDHVFLATIILGFTAVCATLVGRASIWFDEAFGAYLIRFDISELTHYTGMDVHPPLYYYLLKAWSLFFGSSDVALRSLSIVLAVAVLVTVFYGVRIYLGRRVAYMSLILVALSPMFVRYAVEMRMYTLVMLIAVAATFVLLQATFHTSKRWWIAYALLVAAGMLTHYFSALIWLSHWAWRALDTRQRDYRKWAESFFSKQWLLSHILAVALFAPWLPWLLSRIGDLQTNGFWIPPVNPESLLNLITNYFMYENANTVGAFATIGFIAATIILLRSSSRALWISKNDNSTKARSLMISVVIVPPALLILLSLPPLQPIFLDRYLLTSLIFTSVLFGIILVYIYDRRPKLAFVTFSIILALMIIGVKNVEHYGNFNKFDNTTTQTKQVIDQIRHSRFSSSPIVANSPWVYYEAAQYSRIDSPVYFIGKNTEYKYGSLEMLRENKMGKIENLDSFIQRNQRFWYIGRPGNNELPVPKAGLNNVYSFRISDDVTGAPAYEAVLYSID